MINIFENLINLEFAYLIIVGNDYERLIICFDMISQYRTLKQIKTRIKDHNLNVDIFGKMILVR